MVTLGRDTVKKGLKILIPLVVLVVLFIPLGVIIQDTASADNLIYDGVYINNVYVGGMTKDEAKKALNENLGKKFDNKRINIKYEDKTFVIDYRRLKAHYDIDSAVDKAYSYGKEGNMITKSLKRIKLKSNNANIVLDFIADVSIVDSDIKKIASKINTNAVDAKITYTDGSFNVTEDKNGIKVNEVKLSQLIKDAVRPDGADENIVIPVDVVEAKIQGDELSKINAKLSGFKTAFKLSDSNRTGNIRVAAKALNGTVILPGEVFSMNKTLGPRVASKGYTEAPVIINGTLTPGLAGGICQVSSTLYNSVLIGNFEIVERRPHGLKVGYVDAGRDATISGDVIDFKFKNTTSNPIYIQTVMSGATISVNIFGVKEGPVRTIKIVSEIYERIPAKIENINDPTLDQGKKVVEVKPIDGIKSKTYRNIYENGKLVKSELLSKDFYRPATGKVRVGTKPVKPSNLPTEIVETDTETQTEAEEVIEVQ
jgi:vancomycin resistance protein YoaR